MDTRTCWVNQQLSKDFKVGYVDGKSGCLAMEYYIPKIYTANREYLAGYLQGWLEAMEQLKSDPNWP